MPLFSEAEATLLKMQRILGLNTKQSVKLKNAGLKLAVLSFRALWTTPS